MAVVTGASRGIGHAIALRFARLGAHVVGASRSPPPAPFPGAFVATDVSDHAAVRQVFERAIELYGGLDVLVNNAAVEHEGTVEETTLEAWNRVLAVNLTGAFLCSKEAIPHLRRRGGGAILNIGSIEGLWAEPGLSAYCASKGGLLALTRSIAIDFGRDHIRCTCICPSYVRTAMLEQYFAAQPDSEAARGRASEMHPLGRMADTEEVASLAAWLASDEATFVSGHPFLIDGGLLAGPPFGPPAT